MDGFPALPFASGTSSEADLARVQALAATLLCPDDEATPGRYKLWELEPGTHCSVIGTCLSFDDLQHLIRKAGESMAPDADDHDIHGYFVTQAAKRTLVSKLIHKALDRKHAPQLARFRGRSPDEMWALWREAMNSGDVAGAYWALMTVKAAPRTMRIRAYNEIHMLSHLMGKSSRDETRQLRRLEALNAEAAQKLERLRLHSDAAVAERDARIRALEAQLAAATRPRAPGPTAEERKSKLQMDRLRARFATLERRLKVERARARSAEHRLATLLEAPQPRATPASLHDAPGSSSDSADGNAPDGTLGGQALLYVGGYPDTTPRMRAHLEDRGGTLLYHDGGIEMQTTRLSGLVSQADAVLCPVSCVSHDACLHLKRLCKRYGKRLVLLRSPGLSGFVSAVSEIAGARPAASACSQR